MCCCKLGRLRRNNYNQKVAPSVLDFLNGYFIEFHIRMPFPLPYPVRDDNLLISTI